MLLGITGFEIRYQLRNPVFWVSIAIFFLLGFGLTASENVSIGTPGGVHENAPNAIAVSTEERCAPCSRNIHRSRLSRGPSRDCFSTTKIVFSESRRSRGDASARAAS